jgi:uncharacterized protein YecE (DUF72 family)
MPKILVGTSGWMYKHWNEKFFPPKVKATEQLPYYSRFFKTVEINSSFYRMPSAETFANWRENSKSGFVFSVKLNQYVTHRKRLIMDEESINYLEAFINNAQELKEKFGALLIQLPPSQKINIPRLEAFLKVLKEKLARKKYKPDLAIEFRHESWLKDEVFELLAKNEVAFVIAHSFHFPSHRILTTDFSYIRLHGPNALFASRYTPKELKEWLKFMKSQRKIKRFYVYFNNDYEAYAIENATYLNKTLR